MFCNSIQNKVCPFLIRQYQSTVEIQKNKANDENLPWFDVSFALTVVLLKHRFPGIFCIIINILNENFSCSRNVFQAKYATWWCYSENWKENLSNLKIEYIHLIHVFLTLHDRTLEAVCFECLMNEMCKFINKTDGSHTELENVYIV